MCKYLNTYVHKRVFRISIEILQKNIQMEIFKLTILLYNAYS